VVDDFGNSSELALILTKVDDDETTDLDKLFKYLGEG
jgi:hypothetical protein